MNFLNRIERDQEEMVTVLRDLISIPSVKDEPVENGPFGKEIAKALDYVLAWERSRVSRRKTFRDMPGTLNMEKERRPSVFLSMWMLFRQEMGGHMGLSPEP